MIVEAGPAKLNLALHVRARRPDGYHEIETFFAFVEHGDELRVAPAETDDFTLSGPFAAALAGEGDNLVLRARDAFRERFGLAPVAVTLTKNLPIASGIGGGSADAAATLRALARLSALPGDAPALGEIAAALGSDVPACLLGRSAVGSGRGERLSEAAFAPAPVLLVNPGVAVSTAQVFRRWDGIDRGPLPHDPRDGRNDLEPPARAIAPAIGEVLDALAAQSGATLVRMSGSGATCFALFDTEAARDAAAAAMPAGWWTLATRLRA